MQEYADSLGIILLFGSLGVVLLYIAQSKGFFRFPRAKEKRKNLIPFKMVLAVFGIYLIMTMLVAPILVYTIKSLYEFFTSAHFPMIGLGWIQLFILVSIILLFYFYSNSVEHNLFQKIWKDQSIDHPQSILTDIGMGIMTWFISFPLIIALEQTIETILSSFFQFKNYEQVAVRYLKQTIGTPSMLTIALFTILLAAPIIEEFLFRGTLQTFFKRYMTPRYAIILSAACFAFFHFSFSQGIGNVSLVISLFLFALFLGFIYERQASLFSSIALHITFNAVSAFRILFFSE